MAKHDNDANNGAPTPEPTPAATPSPRTPENFVREELVAAEKAWNRTKIYGTLIFLLLAVETIVVSARFALALQPHEAAVIASGIVTSQLDEHADAIKDGIRQRIPEIIQQSPDYVIQQLPMYRQTLEDKVNASLESYTQSTSAALGTHMDEYLDQNKDQIQALLTNASDPAAMKTLGPSLNKELVAYLAEKPASGESIQDQIDKSLSMLKDVRTQMDHLASGSNLTDTDKQTRHALAVIAGSVTKENLQPIPLKQALPTEVESAEAPAPAAPTAAPAPSAAPAPPVPASGAKPK